MFRFEGNHLEGFSVTFGGQEKGALGTRRLMEECRQELFLPGYDTDHQWDLDRPQRLCPLLPICTIQATD